MAAKTTVKAKPVQFEEGWPVDETGAPLTKISFAVSELVPTGNYANITIGPAQATTFVPGAEEEIAVGIDKLAQQVEAALGHRRDQILKELETA